MASKQRRRGNSRDQVRLAVVTPIGPGHDGFAADAIESVRIAEQAPGCFTSIRHVVIDDSRGEFGRGRARNLGMVDDADWYFFLDADDRMRPDALSVDPREHAAQAVFGAVSLTSAIIAKNIHPCGWRDVALCGARGTLSMGFFCRADIARRLRFNEAMDIGEDFEFYLRLDSFAKIEAPLVDIGYELPSAGGPRGYVDADWLGICNELIADAVAREPGKYDLRGDAVLAQAGHPRIEPFGVPRSLSA